MDHSGRSGGSASSNGSGFVSNNAVRPNQQQPPNRFQGATPPFGQPFQGASSPVDQQRIFQRKLQEMQLQQLRQNHMQQQQRMQQQHLSPGSNQLQQQAQSQDRRRMSLQLSPDMLGMSPSSLIGTPNYGRAILGTPTSNTLVGMNSFSSLKSVLSHFQKQPSQDLPLPPAPPFGPRPATTETASNPIAASSAGMGDRVKSNAQLESQPNTDSSSTKKIAAVSAAPLEHHAAVALVKRCDWVDKTLWVSRQLLGGQSVNGFLRSTATVQRIKKQRARQNNKGKGGSTGDSQSLQIGEGSKKRGSENTDQEAEEVLKKEVMNSRTAKKMKTEFEMGINFCRMLHSTVRAILQEMDPALPSVDRLESSKSKHKHSRPPITSHSNDNKNAVSHPTTVSSRAAEMNASSHNGNASATALNKKGSNDPSGPSGIPASPVPRQESPSAASPGNPNGSTLRKLRKKKLPPSTSPIIDLPEFDDYGKRICTKKEHLYRLSECVRYRALRQGDVVAARISSRDLCILARVLKDYPDSGLPQLDFVRLPELKREQLFQEKVLVKDVEDKSNDSSSTFKVTRNLILPLPRSFTEAAEWGQRYKKGTRVYALYPSTTALYTATILDSTTYARDDDDIMVVRFDGDEPDSSGTIPACHIPSRYVTPLPKGFPGVQSSSLSAAPTTTSVVSGTSKKKKGSGLDPTQGGSASQAALPMSDSDFMDHNLDDLNLDGFDDLDFDLLGDS